MGPRPSQRLSSITLSLLPFSSPSLHTLFRLHPESHIGILTLSPLAVNIFHNIYYTDYISH